MYMLTSKSSIPKCNISFFKSLKPSLYSSSFKSNLLKKQSPSFQSSPSPFKLSQTLLFTTHSHYYQPSPPPPSSFFNRILAFLKLYESPITTLVIFSILSLQLGALYVYTNDAVIILDKDNFNKLKLVIQGNDNDMELGLKSLRDATAYNDSIKYKIINDKEMADNIINNIIANKSITSRNCAIKIIDNIVKYPDIQKLFISYGYHKIIIQYLNSGSMYMSKTAASIITQLLNTPENREQLILDGALKLALIDNKIMSESAHLALQDTGDTCKLSDENKSLLKPFLDNRKTKINVNLLYLHTICGGALWGLCSSLYFKTHIAKNVFRTALITGLMPAIFMGGVVTLFTNHQKKVDTTTDAFMLYAGSLFGIGYPMYYILPYVELFAPLWVGGHVVGFCSYFSYLVYSESDLMKSDVTLESADALQRTKELKRLRREAELEAQIERELKEKQKIA